MKHFKYLLFFLVLGSAVFALGNKNGKERKIIAIDGSSTVYPITEAVAEEFQNQNKNVKVVVGISGTGGGFKKFYAGETDISDASRTIKKKEIKKLDESGYEFIEVPVAFDGLAVVVNKDNDWVQSMTIPELKKLWDEQAQDTVMKWSDVRSDWPDEEIHLFGPGADSGTYDYFKEAVIGKKGGTRGDFTASEDDNVLVQGIASDKYALGFFGLAYYQENSDRLKLLGVDGGKGPVKPSLETVKNGSYSPLSRPLFIYIRKDALEKKEVEEFVDFYLDHAGELSKDVGYIPLPEEAYDKVKERVENKVTGTVFASAPIGKSIEEILAKEDL